VYNEVRKGIIIHEVNLMSDIFISYSRDDKAFVQQLHEAFSQEKQDIWIDWESIAPSKAWWDEIKRGIAIANNFVMVMSPNSMSSPICHMEIEHARILGKRIIPVLYKPFDEMCINRISERLNKPDQVFTRELWGTRQEFTLFHENQKALAPINYFFFAPEDDFNDKFQKLLEIIQTDFDHKESHTRLGLRAEQWANRNHDVSFLLDGEELKGAERWMDEALKQGKMPPPTTLQTEYIRASRADEDSQIQRMNRIRRARLYASILAGMMLFIAFLALFISATAFSNLNVVNTQVAYAQATVTQISRKEAILSVVSGAVIVNDTTSSLLARIDTLVDEYADVADAWFYRGLIYAHDENYRAAVNDYTQAVLLNPQYTTAYYYRGIAYRELQDYDRAIADYDQAIRLDPQNVAVYNARGIVYRELGDYDRAIADYHQVLQISPTYFNAYSNLGFAYYYMAQDETDSELRQYYFEQALQNFRAVESLGRDLNDSAQDAVRDLERMLMVVTPTP
jgi:tetratricopeptide (TPR) repeat protein